MSQTPARESRRAAVTPGSAHRRRGSVIISSRYQPYPVSSDRARIPIDQQMDEQIYRLYTVDKELGNVELVRKALREVRRVGGRLIQSGQAVMGFVFAATIAQAENLQFDKIPFLDDGGETMIIYQIQTDAAEAKTKAGPYNS